jgi:predicted enzyme related to lactoylglutathione lyase
MSEARTYPEGVTSWIDIEHRDVEAAQAFYRGLFGWTFADATPPAASSRYVVAKLNGLDAAGIGGSAEAAGRAVGSSAWNTYVAVTDADAAAARIEAAGGRVLAGPSDVGEAGRSAVCADPSGVPFRLWQAGQRLGAQVVNTPGAWNFSDLQAADPAASAAFYSAVFGWSVDDLGLAMMICLPGYGDHLEATSDPEIRTRQAGVAAPPGFADAIGWLAPVGADEQPHWHVSFTVADRDATATAAERLGGTVLGRTDSDWTRDALIRDPQGGVFTVSQFTPPTA